MKYKLIDVHNHEDEDVDFGTCELCMSVGTHYYEVYEVRDENGKHHFYESGEWSWGSYFEYSYGEIENVINFASWFSTQELPEDMTQEYFWHRVYDKYVTTVQKQEEWEDWSNENQVKLEIGQG